MTTHNRTHSLRKLSLKFLAVGLLGVAAVYTGVSPAAAEDQPQSCRTVQIPVTIGSEPTSGQITGDYCEPRQSNDIVLLLVGGGAENADYWNMPGLSEGSLALSAARAGYASLAIDRLGTGRSTIPRSSVSVTYPEIVSTTEQTTSALRHNPALFGRSWSKVVGIGHSLGSGTLAGVAANTPSALDALILTGYGPQVTPQTAELNALYQKPANTVDPKWAGLDDGYLTVVPTGVDKVGLFYLPDTTPHTLALAATHQGTLSKTELQTRPQGGDALAQGGRVQVPALIVDGQHDRHYCEDNPIDSPATIAPTCADQQAFYNYEKQLLANTCLATRVLPDTGHAFAEEKNSAAINRMLLGWLRATIEQQQIRCAMSGPIPSADTTG
ncbi:alpha/beta fold hydrolase [Nocardia sp. BSTN01]|uniref:alpha/beta hydrolase n=1 Tax=Nocardia sp. BSTN01 TaxID=2783665 RepID=UPI00188DDCA2|nr:alpha/beta fold hydrolase [Nocardia sp. BSTN01]MBF5001918.1 alpha/beta fold hydrolase [Nocardia sp. BSTN01]